MLQISHPQYQIRGFPTASGGIPKFINGAFRKLKEAPENDENIMSVSIFFFEKPRRRVLCAASSSCLFVDRFFIV